MWSKIVLGLLITLFGLMELSVPISHTVLWILVVVLGVVLISEQLYGPVRTRLVHQS